MNDLPASVRTSIISRAENRCEYCGLSQAGQEAVFHIDHILPRSAGGATIESNLALACVSCSLHKAAKETAADPDSGEPVTLFNPRLQSWTDHFWWKGEIAAGKTPVGRATIVALKLNRPLILAIRKEEAARGRFPHV